MNLYIYIYIYIIQVPILLEINLYLEILNLITPPIINKT